MDQPTSRHAKSTVPNHKIGLNSDKIDEMNLDSALFRFLYAKKEAPVPKRTVGRPQAMREKILQMSLFPDIYDHKKPKHPGNVDFGEMD